MLDEHRLRLPDAVNPVFRLRDVARRPVKLGEDYVRGAGKRQTDAGGADRADEDPGRPGLEGIDLLLTLDDRGVARHNRAAHSFTF